MKNNKRSRQDRSRLEKIYDKTYKDMETTALAITKSEFFKSGQWKQLRYRALKELGNVCMLCGGSPRTGSIIHVDHILPRSIYPELALDIKNLQILCLECNEGKSNKDKTDWRDGGVKVILRKHY